jgi:small-conductance mechanosensitive channel
MGWTLHYHQGGWAATGNSSGDDPTGIYPMSAKLEKGGSQSLNFTVTRAGDLIRSTATAIGQVLCFGRLVIPLSCLKLSTLLLWWSFTRTFNDTIKTFFILLFFYLVKQQPVRSIGVDTSRVLMHNRLVDIRQI